MNAIMYNPGPVNECNNVYFGTLPGADVCVEGGDREHPQPVQHPLRRSRDLGQHPLNKTRSMSRS